MHSNVLNSCTQSLYHIGETEIITKQKPQRGGGCWLFHKPQIKSTRLHDFELNVNFLEDLWVRIYQPSHSVYICVVYITLMEHNRLLYDQFFNKLRENISKLQNTDRLIVVGDFNLSEIQWNLNSQNTLDPSNVKTVNSMDLVNTMQFTDLQQFNHILNHRHVILDLILSNESPNTIDISRGFPLVVEDSYHPSISISLLKQINLMEVNDSQKKLNFRKANYSQINEALSSIDWQFLDPLSINDAIDKFYNVINTIIEQYVPKKGKGGKYPFWYKPNLIALLKNKERARRKWKKTENEKHYKNFSELRATAKIEIEKCHQSYLNRFKIT